MAITVLMGGALFLAMRGWLADHPQHDPTAPLDLRQQRGWATQTKLSALRKNAAACRETLKASGIEFIQLPPTGEGECRREDRMTLAASMLAPADVQFTCPVAAGLALWAGQDLQPLAQAQFGMNIERIENLGTYSCRKIGDSDSGNWSEHSTGNAIDIAAFVLEDGRRISVLRDWTAQDAATDADARFLKQARDAACASFGTVLSPDYNDAHADHLHLDQGRSPAFGFCR